MYAADPSFAEGKAGDMTYAEGLRWKGERIAILNSVDTKRSAKRPIHETFHGHPVVGMF